MSRGLPVARETRWLYVLPQILALSACVAVGAYFLGTPVGLIGGASLYLIYSFGSRALIPRHHRLGVTLMRRGKWAEALNCFERSEAFFERWEWIDRFRPVVLMSPSGASYREMALLNQASCQVQLGRGVEAKQLYERVLELYPSSPLAASALKLMEVASSVQSRPVEPLAEEGVSET